ncbi:MAG: hypothetical protein QW584_01605 [Thermofilaceae archaeon]
MRRGTLSSRVLIFGVSEEPVEGVGTRSTPVEDMYVVTIERFQTVRSLQNFVAALRKLYSLPQVAWICVQGRLSTPPSWTDEVSSVKPPREVSIGLIVDKAYRVGNIFVVLDNRKVFRVCVQRPKKSKAARYSNIYAVVNSLTG